jgi:hypothetical protein
MIGMQRETGALVGRSRMVEPFKQNCRQLVEEARERLARDGQA